MGIVGVGNCASSFVQGLSYYRGANADDPVPGLMHLELGGYHVGDIEIACRLRRRAARSGATSREAIVAPPNNTQRFADVPRDRHRGAARPHP